MVGMGGSSSSGTPSEMETSNREIYTTFGGAILGMGVLLLGVSGIIMSLPEPKYSSSLPSTKMLTTAEASRAAGARLKASRLEQAKALENPPPGYSPSSRRMANIRIASSDEAAKAARSRRLARSAGAENFESEYIERCEDERWFLIDLLTDRQLNEFLDYLKVRDFDFDSYSAETLKKDSCCCGATIMSPCACMFEGVMDCSAVEPKCPCYEWPSNINSPIELNNYESKCPRCKTDLTEEWWEEVHDEELGDWEVEEGGRAKFYRTWYGNCPSCRSYLELPDDDFDITDMYVAESFALEYSPQYQNELWRKGDRRIVADYDEDFWNHDVEGWFDDEEEYEQFRKQVKEHGVYVLALEKQVQGEWEWVDSLRGNVPNENRTLMDIAREQFEFNEAESFEVEELIPIGTKVRSYDFWPHNKECYKEGVIVDHAPSPSCSPNCLHYHIKTTKVVMGGKLYNEEKGEIFMTHPYADPWDQEYSGQLAPHIQIISTAFPSTSVQ